MSHKTWQKDGPPKPNRPRPPSAYSSSSSYGQPYNQGNHGSRQPSQPLLRHDHFNSAMPPPSYPANPTPYPANPTPYPANPTPYPANPNPYPANPAPYQPVVAPAHVQAPVSGMNVPVQITVNLQSDQLRYNPPSGPPMVESYAQPRQSLLPPPVPPQSSSFQNDRHYPHQPRQQPSCPDDGSTSDQRHPSYNSRDPRLHLRNERNRDRALNYDYERRGSYDRGGNTCSNRGDYYDPPPPYSEHPNESFHSGQENFDQGFGFDLHYEQGQGSGRGGMDRGGVMRGRGGGRGDRGGKWVERGKVIERGGRGIERGGRGFDRGGRGIERGGRGFERGGRGIERGGRGIERGSRGIERGSRGIERGGRGIQRGGRGLERGGFGSQSMHDLHSELPLGCEASKFNPKNKRGKGYNRPKGKDKKHFESDEEEEDDDEFSDAMSTQSAQSMPVKGKGPLFSKKEHSYIERKHRKQFGDDEGNDDDNTSVSSARSMPMKDKGPTFSKKEHGRQQFGDDKGNDDDDDDDDDNMNVWGAQIMPVKGRYDPVVKNKQQSKFNRGEGCNTTNSSASVPPNASHTFTKRKEICNSAAPLKTPAKPFKQKSRGTPVNNSVNKLDGGAALVDRNTDQAPGSLKVLNVTLKINTVFDDTEAMKDAVRENLIFLGCKGEFELQFKGDNVILYKEKRSRCGFFIITDNIHVAKQCVHKMTFKLRGIHKTYAFSQMYLDKKKDKQPGGSAFQEKDKADDKGKKVDDVSEGKKNRRKTKKSNQVQMAVGSDEIEMTDKANTNIPLPQPVTMTFKVEKTFYQSKERFLSFVSNLIKAVSAVNDYKFQDESVQMSELFSQCSIDLKSKADEKRLRKAFIKIEKEQMLKFEILGTVKKEDISSGIGDKIPHAPQISVDVEKQDIVWLSQVQKVTERMEKLLETALQKHDDKMLALNLQLTDLNADDDSKNALMDKRTEANNQRMEFISKCKLLQQKIETLKQNTSSMKRNELRGAEKDFGVECNRLSNGLPIYARRSDIVKHVRSHQVSIVLGETGSGKSTQLAQYLHEAELGVPGRIVCTQPRKVAAVQLAERVANEMAVPVGEMVGYKTGNRRKMNDKTKIVFMTDHSLLNECLDDKDFEKYSCIIVDEAHERSIYTDLLLGMIKSCLQRRPDLKVIITSATIDPKVFIAYFGCQPEIRVSGRMFPVEVEYLVSVDDFENYEEKAVAKAVDIHKNEPAGDILVFLTSPLEIQRCCQEFSKTFANQQDFTCLPLHGQLQAEEQKKVFAKEKPGVRKVVFATNCAETSITIDGIHYVIDSGVSKEMRFDARKNLNLLGVHVISQSSANQRKGRAGRTASGKCFRLYSQEGFEGMDCINEPEIMRVPLAQAVLKLAELGVNICEYDFVKSPDDEAMLAAVKTLEFLGAIDDDKITEMGKWISRLPFDPKLGCMVYNAWSEDLLYDAIVLASTVSNGSGLFYRGLTETEEQISARSKQQFDAEGGDVFSWFEIYKQWSALPRQQKQVWCRSNCLNYKCLNFIKQCVSDVRSVFSIEFKFNVEEKFSDQEEANSKLGRLMFFSYGQSICHFLGHARAGYFSLYSERQVHLHPSSTVSALNIHPPWLVFTEVFKTCREYIKGVLVIDESWILEAIEDGHLDIDISKAKEQTLTEVYQSTSGSSAFRALVGPRYSKLKVMENECEELGMKHAIVEANAEAGRLSIYSSSPVLHPEMAKKMEDLKREIINSLQIEQWECYLFSKETSQDSPNIRVVLGRGGVVRNLLMPDQTNQVLVRKAGECSEEEIRTKFSAFGEVMDVISFKCQEPWGFVRYRSIKDAEKAVENTKKDETMVGSLKLPRGSKNSKNLFEARVSWLRRPVKNDGTAFIQCDTIYKPFIVGRSIFVNGGERKLQMARKKKSTRNSTHSDEEDEDDDSDRDLIIFKIGNTSEDTIKEQIAIIAGEKFDLKVFIPRQRVPLPSRKEMDDMKLQLQSKLDPQGKEKFSIWITRPKEESVYQTAFLQFMDPVPGLKICQRYNERIFMEGQPVRIAPALKTQILVPDQIKEACKDQMKDLFVSMKRDLRIEVDWIKVKENHFICIKSPSPEGIVRARECIGVELNGDVIDCVHAKVCQSLFTTAGQKFLKQIQANLECTIISDKRTQKVHLYGKEDKVTELKGRINQFLSDVASKTETCFKLKGLGKPPGIMKALMKKFGPLLDNMASKFDLSSVHVDWKSHTLSCSGSDGAIEEFRHYMAALEGNLAKTVASKLSTPSNALPECVVCLDTLESGEACYRLESCGHAYCINCVRHQGVVCIQNNQIPLTCAAEDCGLELVWRDLRYMLSKKLFSENKLVNASLNVSVRTQPDKYKFCPTPNCPVVYEVTLDASGCEFNCPACFASTCSSCHFAFHAGVTCNMVESVAAAEKHLEQWCESDRENRKICPKCRSPIEKIEGCNKMKCTSCHQVFCWICLEVYEDEQKCYAHLAKVHGGFI